ncbi:Protein argonaute, N-terminal [Dillenia turbinata]|uniref:Protein argonaute, N-terminal n=1 Tax=Dillenia turbinata TaxID=194707 RepID=A0AAN8W635_9MAGN
MVQVQIYPASTNRVVNRALIHEIATTHSKLLEGKLPAYDGVQRLYTAGPLPFNSKEFPVKYADDNGGKEKEYKVTIKLTAKADIHHLKEYLQGRLLDVPRETIQCLEIVLRQSSTSK